MICCRPPFQASSSSEIYEKAKAVDYQWPEEKMTRSHVPEEAKDLVAALLKPDPEDRLCLDEVVNHPFFSMHGGDCIPAVLDPNCKNAQPDWLSTAEPRGDAMNVDAPRLRLRDLAESCGVGYPHRGSHSFNVVGGDVDISLYKACLAEETAGTCPRVPLPNDIVYNGKTSPEARSFIRDSETPPVPPVPQSLRNKTQDRLDTLPEDGNADVAQPISPRRSATQTLAAYSRNTQSRPTASRASSRTVPDPPACEPKAGISQPPVQASESASMRVPQGLMHERPVRWTRTLPRTSRVTRSQKTGMTKDDAIPIYDEEAKMMSPRLTRDQIIDQLSPNPEAKRREIALRGKARIAANLQNELNALNTDDKRPAKPKLPTRSRRAPKPVGWLLAPKEKIEAVPETTADNVYARLRQLQHELSLAIDHAGERSVQEADLDDADKPEETPPLITKWVDYTNKLGVGYTFDNGSMGCLLKANESYENPQCGVLVAQSRTHYQKRSDPSYTEADQIVPQDGPPVEFSEISEESGITRVLVPATRFKATSRTQDGGAKMRVSRDIHEVEKKRRLGIWSRFAEYMVQNLAMDAFTEAEPTDNGEYRPGRFLRFYQRLGNVSIWAFVDGAFQFNFPDHTKLILYGDGKWIDLYYMPPAMMKRLKSGRPLDQQMLDGRKKLGYSPATFVQLCSSDGATARTEELKTIVQVNEMQSKISFVKSVVDIWVQAGGLGRLGENKYVKWDGFQAKKGLAWVSVGANGGDHYYKWPGAKE